MPFPCVLESAKSPDVYHQDVFEHGKLTRRQLIQTLALAAAATAAPGISAAADGKGFKTIGINHISYVVADFKKTRDFYTDLMGMTVAEERAEECRLSFGSGIPGGWGTCSGRSASRIPTGEGSGMKSGRKFRTMKNSCGTHGGFEPNNVR
jgi:hypothetical protein